jgi:hypothetical protein
MLTYAEVSPPSSRPTLTYADVGSSSSGRQSGAYLHELDPRALVTRTCVRHTVQPQLRFRYVPCIDACERLSDLQTSASVSIRQHTSAMHASASVTCIRQHASACASMRQHAPPSVSIQRCMRASQRPATRRMLGGLQAARATGPPQPPHSPRERDPPHPSHARSRARGSASEGKRTAKLVVQKYCKTSN